MKRQKGGAGWAADLKVCSHVSPNRFWLGQLLDKYRAKAQEDEEADDV
jgi:hypothetical protein